MRIFIHLVRKELRDVRWLARGAALGTAAIALAAAWLLRWHWSGGAASWADDFTTPALNAWTGVAESFAPDFVRGGVAIAVALCGGAVAADLFAGEAVSRRIEGTAMLPIPLGRVFAAKTTALLLACLVFAGCAGASACAAARLFWGDGPAMDAVMGLPDAGLLAVAALAVVALVSLFAVLLEHGLGALMGGIVLVGLAALQVVRMAPWMEWGFMPSPEAAAAFAGAAALPLFAAAGLAFVRGPIHLGRRVRRVALGLVPAAAVLVAGTTATAAILDARTDVAPGDTDAVISNVLASPDGRHAVMIVGTRRAEWTCRIWIVDVADGRTIVLPHRFLQFRGWSNDGCVRLAKGRPVGTRVEYDDVVSYDLRTGALVRTRSEQQDKTEAWTVLWARCARTQDGFLVEWTERGLKQRFQSTGDISISPRPGRFLVWDGGSARLCELEGATERLVGVSWGPDWVQWVDGGRVLRFRGARLELRELDCDTGVERALVPPEGTWSLGFAGPYAAYSPRRGVEAVVDLRDGRTVAGPFERRAMWRVPGDERHLLVYGDMKDPELLDPANGRLAPIGPLKWEQSPMNLIHGLPDGTFVVARQPGCLDLIDEQGRVVRSLIRRGN